MLTLQYKLEELGRLFDLEGLSKLRNSPETIKHYYQQNHIPYRIFHNREHLLHLGISEGGSIKPGDLYTTPKIVENWIRSRQSQRVLEIGGGHGMNSLYLAKRNPTTSFVVTDFSADQLYCDMKEKARTTNFRQIVVDFHDLNDFAESSFDLIFAIETLCHSTNIGRVLWEVRRCLKPTGIFIIIDGYLNKPLETLCAEEKMAVEITQKGLAVEAFIEYEQLLRNIRESSFEILEEVDYSSQILPTLQRFEKLAVRFMKLPGSRLLARTLPGYFLGNVVSGYLMLNLILEGIATYHLTVAEKGQGWKGRPFKTRPARV